MLKPIENSIDLLKTLQRKLGPDRLPLIIGIDGRSGAGKSSLASWLAWQLGMPSVHLDLYVERDSEPLSWRYEDLARVITARLAL
jgi:pantothenate kinase-related protein Tda10